ncbi:DUF6602 domain-containing protein [Halomonas heilongjiangensis]|uniref:DUF6602 domain-containing protein n=1 Tax=Halomonas heilongjiangensis TaxID=1387883 RepID=UPI0011AF8475|nr:DUF6602 domain-containing protein [Halomonas heilongjiangensis]
MSTENPIRSRTRIAVQSALQEAKAASSLVHPGLIGHIREILVERILRPVLTPEIHFGTGKLVDVKGNLSKQLDVILYSPEIMPPGLYDHRTGLFPAESCLYSVEVKSKLNKCGIEEAVKGAESIRNLSYLSTEYFFGTGYQQAETPLPICALFAFDSDMSGPEEKEFERFKEVNAGPTCDPLIKVLCIVGRGYWCHSDNGWLHFPATGGIDEVLHYMAGTSNTIPKFLAAKGRPKFGNYLSQESGGVPRRVRV